MVWGWCFLVFFTYFDSDVELTSQNKVFNWLVCLCYCSRNIVACCFSDPISNGSRDLAHKTIAFIRAITTIHTCTHIPILSSYASLAQEQLALLVPIHPIPLSRHLHFQERHNVMVDEDCTNKITLCKIHPDVR